MLSTPLKNLSKTNAWQRPVDTCLVYRVLEDFDLFLIADHSYKPHLYVLDLLVHNGVTPEYNHPSCLSIRKVSTEKKTA